MIDRQRYPVVTWLTVATAIMVLGAARLRQEVPEAELNELARDPQPFLARAGSHLIQWKEFKVELADQSIRAGRPFVIVAGHTGDSFGFAVDQNALRLLDNGPLIQQYDWYRADASLYPQWVEMISPVIRARDARSPGYSILIFNSKGELVLNRGIQSTFDSLNALEVEKLFEWGLDLVKPKAEVPTPQMEHNVAKESLLEPSDLLMPDIEEHNSWLKQTGLSTEGGLVTPQGLEFYPSAWEALLYSGNDQLVIQYADRLTASGMVDWIDGGFFFRSKNPAWGAVSFDKQATLNADAMHLFARLYCLTNVPKFKFIAGATFDYLTDTLGDSGLTRPYQRGEENELNRSIIHSSSPRELRASFDSETRRALAKTWNMGVRANPQMLPILGRGVETLDDESIRLLTLLKNKASKQQRRVSGLRTPSVSGRVASKLLVTARLLNDEARLQRAEAASIALEEFPADWGEPESLRGTLDLIDFREATFDDHVGMAESYLQQFLTTGNPNAILLGAKFLSFAAQNYSDPGNVAAFFPVRPTDSPFAQKMTSPIISDNYTASPIARIIPLLYAYAAIQTTHQMAQGRYGLGPSDFMDLAQRVSLHYGSIATRTQRKLSGFFFASRWVQNDRYVVVEGTDALEKVAELERLRPYLLVIPGPNQDGESTYRIVEGGKPLKAIQLNSLLQIL